MAISDPASGFSRDLLRPKWGQDRVILGDFGLFLSFPRHFGIILATFRDRFGVVLTTLWDHFSAFVLPNLGPFRAFFTAIFRWFTAILRARF